MEKNEDTMMNAAESCSSIYDLEEFPHIDLYRRQDTVTAGGYRERPALYDLHESADKKNLFDSSRSIPSSMETAEQRTKTVHLVPLPDKVVKLGWCSGVVMRGVLSIIGQLLFLRLSWVMGEAGWVVGTLAMLFSIAMNLSSTLSLCAIATNGIIQGGGIYFLLSRTLGPEWGVVSGILLYISNCLFTASCLIGFSETVRTILTNEYNVPIFISLTNDLRIISNLALILLIVLVLINLKFETILMYILAILLAISLCNFAIGAFLPKNILQISKGIIGLSKFALQANMKAKLTNGTSLGELFGILFTAMTGVLAGVNMSENLKNPNKAIPKGTIAATILSGVIYIIAGLLCVATCLPNAPGSVNVMFNLTNNVSIDACGLLKDYNMMKMVSAFGPLTYAGIIAASLSSASANLVAGPKVFQALCRDKILPSIFHIFAKGHPRTDEPIYGYGLTFVIVLIFNLIANLNVISIIAAECTMICYVLINYACLVMSSSKSSGWRPTFRFYHQHLSQVTMIVTGVMMFIVNWVYALISCALMSILYMFAHQSQIEVDWGTSMQARLCTKSLTCLQKHVNLNLHVKNFRPHCLLLSGFPTERSFLLHFMRQMLQSNSLVICGNVIVDDSLPIGLKMRDAKVAQQWLNSRNIRFFYCPVISTDLRCGARHMMQCTGVGQLKPNILVMGFKNDYCNKEYRQESMNYFELIHDAYDMQMGLMIIRHNVKEITSSASTTTITSIKITRDNDDDEGAESGDETFQKNSNQIPNVRSLFGGKRRSLTHTKTDKFIDVYWLFDDGGLSMLLPYLLNQSKHWKQHRIRVFTLAQKSPDDHTTQSISELLALLRIDHESIQMIDLFDNSEDKMDLVEFDRKMEQRMVMNESEHVTGWTPNLNDIDANKLNTLHHMRLRKVIRKYSAEAHIVFITMMVPRKKSIPGLLYLTWLDLISEAHPFVCLIRGNQENVLTHYT